MLPPRGDLCGARRMRFAPGIARLEQPFYGSGMEVQIPFDRFQLDGELVVPADAAGVVLFAHGSGSSRHSPRNQFVARVLREHGVGTLLFDLLTAAEEQEDRFTGHLRFDIKLLSQRLEQVTRWYHALNP